MASGPPDLTILCWNINALVPTLRNIELRHGSLVGFFEHHEADIVCFQETKLLPEKLTRELACLKNYESFWAISRGKRGYSGVVTYVHKRWSPVSADRDCLGSGDSDIDQEGRIVLTDHDAFVLINVYSPNAGGEREGRPRADFKLRFLHLLKDKVDGLAASGKQVILVGDLNIAASQMDVHSQADYAGMYSAAEKAALQSLLNELEDSWRLLHPDTADTFTVWDEKKNARPFNRGVRLDYALLSQSLLPSLVSCEIISTPPKWSDHAALVLKMRGLKPPGLHQPCALSSARTFPAQTSVASLFARKRSSAEHADPTSQAPSKRPCISHESQQAANTAAMADATFMADADVVLPEDIVVDASHSQATLPYGLSTSKEPEPADLRKQGLNPATLTCQHNTLQTREKFGAGRHTSSPVRAAESDVVTGKVNINVDGLQSSPSRYAQERAPHSSSRQKNIESFFAKRAA